MWEKTKQDNQKGKQIIWKAMKQGYHENRNKRTLILLGGN